MIISTAQASLPSSTPSGNLVPYDLPLLCSSHFPVTVPADILRTRRAQLLGADLVPGLPHRWRHTVSENREAAPSNAWHRSEWISRATGEGSPCYLAYARHTSASGREFPNVVVGPGARQQGQAAPGCSPLCNPAAPRPLRGRHKPSLFYIQMSMIFTVSISGSLNSIN